MRIQEIRPALSLTTCAVAAGVSVDTIRRRIQAGELKAVRVGKKALRIPAEEWVRYVESRRVSS